MNPAKGDSFTTIRASPDMRERYRMPAHGWLELIELRPRVELPNMNAGVYYELIAELIDPDGNKVPLEVFARARDVA